MKFIWMVNVVSVLARSLLRVTFVLFFYASPSTSFATDGTGTNILYSLEPTQRSFDQELVLQLHLGRYLLSESFIGFASKGGTLLPLSEITYSLGFPIEVVPSEGLAKGWFLRENRRFSLDYARGEVLIEGQRLKFNPGQIELHEDDIYVHTELLMQWFPVEFAVDYSRMVVKVDPQEPLPLQARMERENKRASLGGKSTTEASHYLREELPYQFINWPYLDVSSSYGLNQRVDPDSNSKERENIWGYSANLSGDLLWMNANLYFSGNKANDIIDVRLALTRKDIDENIPGINITQVSIGDIFTPRIGLISAGTSGNGLEISNFPVSRSSNFSTTDLRGEMALGWEVELYRNGIFLNSLPPRNDGRYEFLGIPLIYGSNVLKLSFYGPQGQRREKTQVIIVGSEQLSPGISQFRFAAIQPGKDLFAVNETDKPKTDIQYSLEYENGLSNNHTLTSSLTRLFLNDTQQTYAGIGLRSSIFGAATELELVKQQNAGHAAKLYLQTRRLGLNINASHAYYKDFSSDDVTQSSSNSQLSSSELRLDTSKTAGVLPSIPISLSGTFDRFESGRQDLSLSNRLSLHLKGASLTNTLDWSESRQDGISSNRSATGSFLMNAPLQNSLRARASLNYTLAPTTGLDTARLTLDWNQDSNKFRFGAGHNLTSHDTSYSFSVNRLFQNLTFGFSANYSDNGNAFLGASLSFGLGREPRSGDWHMQSRNLSDSGGISARVFMDENLNGRYDEGEPPLEGVRIAHTGRDKSGTNAQGLLFLPSYKGHRPVDIALDLASLEDPYLMPTRPGINTTPRPGRTLLVDFPVSYTGEIEGTVHMTEGKHSKSVSNVELLLIGTNGKTVAETRTAFDGFYLFSSVLPGEYRVQPSIEQTTRLKLELMDAESVSITAEGNRVSGIDFKLRRNEEKSPTQQTSKLNAQADEKKSRSPETNRLLIVER
ncbi:Outer membrane usher protein FimD/PapC [Neptunomonas qingdaonensis]|uniref:Outer membrane usher protein FimD/PapC n=2 Tax=Neptunomonas qingdaonensis TaxID=1045558 RepID=A0A1I2MGF7_9GAMM|nr:Outer membrane usher protein FimD/PapC [Neptunomonas qingdaonensis]